MVSLASFASMEWGNGETTLERFNGLPSVRISADSGSGYSSGTAMARLSALVRDLGAPFGVRWTGRAFEQLQSGDQAPWLFACSALFIFLCLVALYESWTLPLAVCWRWCRPAWSARPRRSGWAACPTTSTSRWGWWW